MPIKNSIIILNYLTSIYKLKRKNLSIRLLSQNLILKGNVKSLNLKSVCLYTNRYKSVYSSYKMSRYKLKNFLDNRSLFNVYSK
jgi:hypothetical protein